MVKNEVGDVYEL